MKQQPVEDALQHHYDMLAAHGEAKAALLETDPSTPAEASGLFAIVRLLWETLVPMKPSAEFRQGLHLSLVAEAERRRVQKALGMETARKILRPFWLVPVAALGTASLVGAYAFWRRSRHLAADEQQALAA